MSVIIKHFGEILGEHFNSSTIAFDLDGCLVYEFFGISNFLDTLQSVYRLAPHEIIEIVALYESWLGDRDFDWIGDVEILLGKGKNVARREDVSKSQLVNLFNNRRYPFTRNRNLHKLLAHLAETNVLILVTNGLKSRQSSKIKALGISQYFVNVYFCDDIAFPAKPNFCPLVDGRKIDFMIGDRIIDREFAIANAAKYVYLGDSFFRG